MDLTQLTNLGEFIGGVAVVVTLIYLASQVRHARNQVRLESELDLSGRAAELSFSYAREPEMARALELAVLAPEEMTKEETYRGFWIIAGYFHMIEALYLRSLDGAISEQAGEAHAQIVSGLVRSPFTQALWNTRQRFAYTAVFREFIGERIREQVSDDYWSAVPPEDVLASLTRRASTPA